MNKKHDDTLDNLKKLGLTIAGGALLSTNIAAQNIATRVENAKDTLDKHKYSRAFELPQPNTTYVGSAIIGVAPTVMIAAGQEYNFNTHTGPNFNPGNFPVNITFYNIEDLVTDAKKRVNFYKKHPEIVSKSRLERDEAAIRQIENEDGYHIDFTKDSALVNLIKKYAADLILDEGETTSLAMEVAKMDQANVSIGAKVEHKGAIVNGKKYPGESIIMDWKIAYLVVGQDGTTTAVPDTIIKHDTIPCPKCPPCDSIPPRDTIPKTKQDSIFKKGFQVYALVGVEDNPNFNEFIMQYAAGIKSGKFSVGLRYGNKKGITTEDATIHFPSMAFNPRGDYVQMGETIDSIVINKDIIQLGAEVGFDITKHLRLIASVDYNMMKGDTSESVNQWAMDDAGNRRDKPTINYPLRVGEYDLNSKKNFFTINVEGEYKTNLNNGLDLGIVAGAKFPINAHHNGEAAYKGSYKPSYVVGGKIYFGKGRGYRKK